MNEPRKKMGRPAGSGAQTNWVNVNFQIDGYWKKELETVADKQGVSLGKYLRRIVSDFRVFENLDAKSHRVILPKYLNDKVEGLDAEDVLRMNKNIKELIKDFK